MARPGNFPVFPTGLGYYSLFDFLTDTPNEKNPPSGYVPFAFMPPSFFDVDFRYVESIPYEDRTFVEKLKRIPVGDCLTFSTGGSIWVRYMDEHNSRLGTVDNTYTLTRFRAYADLLVGDRIRFFGEYLWADNLGSELAPLPIDVNLGDALNLFVDVNLFDYNGNAVFARVGRQELLYGSQRLVTSLDWANTRRTFDGAKLFSRGEKWNLDMWYSAFVPVDPDGLDQLDDSRDFGGAWATYKPKKGHFTDFYYLYFQNNNDVVQQGIVLDPTEVHTFGTRNCGDNDGFVWDCELMMQFGNQNSQDLFAGAATGGVGRNFKESSWSPTFWVYYDYASGTPDPGTGDYHTFNQIYPFGHYYLGWLDLVGRKNIHDANAHLIFYPQPWITIWMQYHHFWLAESRDALYNAGGVAIRRDATGAAGRNVGDEIDFIVNFHIRQYSDVLFSYSQLFGGSFLENTSGPNAASDASQWNLMYQRRW